jgi:RNA polymerase sigma-70 factor (ECF subfamily)
VPALVDVFRAVAPAELASRSDDELARAIESWIAAARQAWERVPLDEQVFVEHVAARLGGADALDVVFAADLWLACACARGEPAACAIFDATFVEPLDPVLAAAGLSPDQRDEVKQELRRKLLTADGDRPRIADFSGRADLRMWVRTAAVRAGIDLLRARRDVALDEDELAALPAIADDPELVHLKSVYREQLRDAVVTAIGQLEARERLLLKYHYIDGLSVDKVGAVYGVHRATAARWIGAARDALAAKAQRVLIATLRVTPSELRSIARLVESQLDVSIRRLLDDQ